MKAPTEARAQIRVVYNDAPVHCIDVLDTRGDRVARIRPDGKGGATWSLTGTSCHLDAAGVEALRDALGLFPVAVSND